MNYNPRSWLTTTYHNDVIFMINLELEDDVYASNVHHQATFCLNKRLPSIPQCNQQNDDLFLL